MNTSNTENQGLMKIGMLLPNTQLVHCTKVVRKVVKREVKRVVKQYALSVDERVTCKQIVEAPQLWEKEKEKENQHLVEKGKVRVREKGQKGVVLIAEDHIMQAIAQGVGLQKH